jgi:hypothetical protein
MTKRFHYMVLETFLDKLEVFLNDLEDMASGSYEIVSIFPTLPGTRTVVGVIVKLSLSDDDDIPFDEDDIKKKLGF